MITLTHAKENEEVFITPTLILCAYYSKAHKATLVMATGGGMVPVKEDKEVVYKLIKESKND